MICSALLGAAGCVDDSGDGGIFNGGPASASSGLAEETDADTMAGSEAGDASAGSDTTTPGTSDGGDGDGDPGTSDSGGDGDGDGDPGTSGSGGDGDGDPGTSDSGGDGDGDGDPGTSDSGGDGDDNCLPGGTGGDLPCEPCQLSLSSTASSVLQPINGNQLLGSAQLFGQTIYALDDVGPGRVIYTADTNVLYNEMTDCPLWEWLGNTATLPEVAGFGKQVCSGLGNNLGNYPTYTHWGSSMPAAYIGDPCALKADFDVVIFCTLGPLDPAVTQTLIDYVQIYGGGLYLASEYYAWADDDDVAAINSISVPFGVEFGKEFLDWGSATGDINFACFPIPQ